MSWNIGDLLKQQLGFCYWSLSVFLMSLKFAMGGGTVWLSNMKPELTLWQLFPKAKNFFVTKKRCLWVFWVEESAGQSCLLCFLIALTDYCSDYWSVSQSYPDFLRPHVWQHTRLPCPSPSPGAYSNLMSIESVMPSNHLIFCYHLFLLLSIFPSIMVFANESVLHIRWP